MTHSAASRANNAFLAAQAKRNKREVIQLNPPSSSRSVSSSKKKEKKKKPGKIQKFLTGLVPQSIQKSLPRLDKKIAKGGLVGGALKVATSTKTTGFLATTLATELGLGLAAGRIFGSAVSSGRLGTIISTRGFLSKGVLTGPRTIPFVRTSRFVGKGGKNVVDKLFTRLGPRAGTAARFGTNAKTVGQTTSLLIKSGLSANAAKIFIGAVGSYIFAGFLKEEAVQTLQIPIMAAIRDGDPATAQRQIDAVNEVLDAQPSIIDKIPYANVIKELNGFFDAARTSNLSWQEILNQVILDREAEALEPSFAEQREQSDLEARERTLQFRAEDEEFFSNIESEREDREKDEERERSKRQKESEATSKEFEERRQRSIDEGIAEREFNTEFFKLIRDKKFAEAEELQILFNKSLKGG